MKTHLLLLPILALAVVAAPPAVRAALIAQESFNYPTGGLFGQGSTAASGWSSSWNASSGPAPTVTTPGLVNPLNGSGIGNAASLAGNASLGAAIARDLNDITPGNNTYYVGFLFRHDTDAPRSTTLALYNATTEMVGAGVSNAGGATPGNMVLYGAGGALANTTVSATQNTTLQLVMKIMFSSTAHETVQLFINQAIEGTPDAQLTTVEIVDFTRVRLFAGGAAAPGAATFDEIRIATTYGEAVIPEPGALALLLGGAAMVCRNSRRRVFRR